jgi:hypothetical protein
VDLVVGLENVRCEIATMRTPDGHRRVELTKFHAPAAVRVEPTLHDKYLKSGIYRANVISARQISLPNLKEVFFFSSLRAFSRSFFIGL